MNAVPVVAVHTDDEILGGSRTITCQAADDSRKSYNILKLAIRC